MAMMYGIKYSIIHCSNNKYLAQSKDVKIVLKIYLTVESKCLFYLSNVTDRTANGYVPVPTSKQDVSDLQHIRN